MTQTPQTLLRFFDTEEHARSFVAGRIRCGLLERYRKIDGEIRRTLKAHPGLKKKREVFLAARDLGVKVREQDLYARLNAMTEAGDVVAVDGLRLAQSASREVGS